VPKDPNGRETEAVPLPPAPHPTREEEQAAIDELIDTMNEFHRKHGLLSGEFSQL
jgi:hypothetical protein